MLMVTGLYAQDVSFSDDFEGYTVGDLIAATSDTWESWGSPGGGADDTAVSDEQANSGALSLKLEAAAAAGGPTDIVLPFGGKYIAGDFVYEQMMYIANGTGAYFNFQGEVTIGQEWVMNNYFTVDGTATFANSDNVGVLQATFPFDTWFQVRIEADLTNNVWEVFMDGSSLGTFSNPNNSIASCNLYAFNPEQGASLLYVDDVSFEYTEAVLLPIDASVTQLFAKPSVLTGREVAVSFDVKNLGTEPILSFDATLDDGTNSVTQVFDGEFLNSLESGTYAFTDATYTALEGSNDITLTVSNINELMDDNMANNVATGSVTGFTPAENRAVLVEEGTGTWCTWCPRGDVFMKYMYREYGDYFVGIAAHQGDPMEVPGYIAATGFSAFPTMKIGRQELFGFGVTDDIENRFFPRLVTPAPAVLGLSATFDEATGNVVLTTSADFSEAASGYRLSAVVMEDEVTGTTAGYNQVNAYSGGGQGPMGGYELLPNPVPAAQMVYDHVARVVLGGVIGEPGSLPASVSAGESHSFDFNATILPDWDFDQIEVAVILMAPDGTSANAKIFNLSDVLETSSVKDSYRNELAKVSPNPFSSVTNVELNLETASNVHMTVFNSTGQLVAERSYGQLSGTQLLPFDGSNLTSGMYIMHIQLDDTLITKKIQLQK